MNILVTGGAGFIGSNFINRIVPNHPEHLFINLDKLTYAANLMSLDDIYGLPNYRLEIGDITDLLRLTELFEEYRPDMIVHFAAESHVDRSILEPAQFIQSNIIGTFNLLETCREFWKEPDGKLFHHISTDEVYGSLQNTGFFTESTAYHPSSPYSASKAAGDHLVRAYNRTYGLPVTITNCSNNYGPRQFPEKLIPLIIKNALEGKPLPLYGKGLNVRDWLYVNDHCDAIWMVITEGTRGETYNIGGGNERTNIALVHKICEITAEETGKDPGHLKKLIAFVQDRPGHDLRYAVDYSKIKRQLGWRPRETFETGLRKTVKWYIENQHWVHSVKSGEYRCYNQKAVSRRAEKLS